MSQNLNNGEQNTTAKNAVETYQCLKLKCPKCTSHSTEVTDAFYCKEEQSPYMVMMNCYDCHQRSGKML